MIPLQLKIDPLPIVEPLVIRLNTVDAIEPTTLRGHDAVLVYHDGEVADFDVNGFSLRVYTSDPGSLNGDVVLAIPGRNTIHRLIRASSRHNTLLVTEQCDQKCIMCSQPPKKYHTDLFDQFLQAVSLAPLNATIGISGGEPLLHKSRLFWFLEKAQSCRPDLSFHILTNGQHIDQSDQGALSKLDMTSILWGIPIYAAQSSVHDQIVAKVGAFDILQRSLPIMGRAGAQIELRTVIMTSNDAHLESLALYIARHLAFAQVWAIMQLENIGYARMNWDHTFQDTSIDFDGVACAIDLASGNGVETTLYNFPLCTVPPQYRRFCVASISDWKQKFLSTCKICLLKSECTGFFEWYPESRGFKEIVAQC